MESFDFLDAIASEDNIFNHSDSPGDMDLEFLSGLNKEQKEAVLYDNGPLLILAGAGSGKTRVITCRIAYLIQKRFVHPSSILAITFTNKAAAEMKERVRLQVGSMADRMWIGTFHSMMARLLRRHAELVGFGKNFVIFDTDDQLRLIKACIQDLELNEKIFIPRNVLAEISRAKNELISAEEFKKQAGKDQQRQVVYKIYKMYQKQLIHLNAMDFDDILYYGVELFTKNKDILDAYQEQFKYILVDEYQDTNHAQYLFIRMLAKKYRNLCVVGDDDQSIYSFRGANIRNILDFENDFKNTKVIKLEQNYRSSSNVLGAANSIIKNNQGRKSKKLWTDSDLGEKITHYVADHHGLEAYFIVNQVKAYLKKGGQYKDVAVLYRVNAISRTIEAALREQGIPYRIFGGFRFYDRKEIKDVLAYLRLVSSGRDNYAFERIINVPKRGIGETSVEKIRQIAIEQNISNLQVCAKASAFPSLSRVSSKLEEFAELIQDFRMKLAESQMTFAEYIEYIQDQSGIVAEILEQKEKKGDTVDRIEIIRELLSEAVEFEARRKAQAASAGSSEKNIEADTDIYIDEDMEFATDLPGILQLYLQNAALYSEGDDQDENEDFVRLLTIHSAKGLEFPVVFMVGVEEGIFPGYRSMESEKQIEEERRLAYVAVTRAKTKLYITTARSRMLFGQTQQLRPSRFVKEISPEFVEMIGSSREPFVESGSNYTKARVVASGGTAEMNKPKGNSVSDTLYAAKQTTGSEAYIPFSQLKKDMRVRHPRFGNGKIIKVEQLTADALVCVVFDNQSKKNMLASQAKLLPE